MKYALLLLIPLFFSSSISSQDKTNIEVTYSLDNSIAEIGFKLCIVNDLSRYSSLGKLGDVNNPKINQVVFAETEEDDFIFYKNHKENKIIYKDIILNQRDKPFFIKDELSKLMEWNLLDEKKEILGMPCKSATTSFRGRKYKAFYTEKIPIPEGPWKFGGLPGLILQIASEDGLYKWKATEILNNQSKVLNYEKYQAFKKNNKFMTWLAYKAKYIKIMKDQIKQRKSSRNTDENSLPRHWVYRPSPEVMYPELENGKGIEY